MNQDDSQIGKFAAREEIPGLDEFLQSQEPISEDEIDAIFIAHMEHLEADALFREQIRTISALQRFSTRR